MSRRSVLHLQRVSRLPCVACMVLLGQNTGPVEIHHIESERHAYSDFLVLPLCIAHHRGSIGVHGLHRQGFERMHKVTQMQLLGAVVSMLLADRTMVVGG